MADITVLSFPEVTAVLPTDVLYLIRGTGIDRDKFIQVKNLYPLTIDSQDKFDAIIEKVSNTVYKIKDDILSINVKFLSGGYSLTLEGADTWGRIQTNNCKDINFDGGAYLDFSTTLNYIYVNTASCFLNGVQIQGSTSTASSVLYGFWCSSAAVGSVFKNCSVVGRKSDATTFSAFRGNGSTTIDDTIKYINCVVKNIYSDTIAATTINCFLNCHNMANCEVNGIFGASTSTALVIFAANTCNRITNFTVYNIDSYYNIMLLSACINITSSYFEKIGAAAHTPNVINIFLNCFNISSIFIDEIRTGAAAGTADLIKGCTNISNVRIYDLQGYDFSGFIDCDGITSSLVDTCIVSHSGNGIQQSRNISACTVTDIETSGTKQIHGIFDCDNVSACRVDGVIGATSAACSGVIDCNYVTGCFTTGIAGDNAGVVGGFRNCDYISSCYPTAISNAGAGSAEGFYSCEYISSVSTDEAVNSGNDWVNTDDAQITNKFSCSAIWT